MTERGSYERRETVYDDIWTGPLVSERLGAAARTLRASQTDSRQRAPSALRVAWPDAPNARAEAYGYTPEDDATRLQPTSADLRAMDEAMAWLTRYLSREMCAQIHLPGDAAWIAFSRAGGMEMKRLGDRRAKFWHPHRPPGGNTREAIRRIAGEACSHVARCLNRDAVSLAIGTVRETQDAAPVATGRGASLPRQMQTKWVYAPAPCGSCARFRAQTSMCVRFNNQVAAAMRAQHPAGDPCYTPKETT